MNIFEFTIFWITIAPTYYWLMYAISFLVWYYIVKSRWRIVSDIHLKSTKENLWDELMDDLFLYIFLWVFLGWRFWYVFFYNFSNYITNPLDILKVWEWWMSFHWWVIWVLLAMYLFSRRFKMNFLVLADQITLILPIWLWLWRIWNYLNKELLWYSWYYWPFAVEKNGESFFPSPLLESFLEWLVLYFILLFFYKRKYFNWQIGALFLLFYWLFRILVEAFFREPDNQIWYILWYFTMWEILSFPMFIIWLILYFRFKK